MTLEELAILRKARRILNKQCKEATFRDCHFCAFSLAGMKCEPLKTEFNDLVDGLNECARRNRKEYYGK